MAILPVIIEDLSEHAGMPVEEVLIEDGVVVGEGLGEPRQPGGGDLLQGGLVGLVADAPHVQDDAVLAVHGAIAPCFWGWGGLLWPAIKRKLKIRTQMARNLNPNVQIAPPFSWSYKNNKYASNFSLVFKYIIKNLM